MPRSRLHVNLSRMSPVFKTISRNGVGRGFLVVVTGFYISNNRVYVAVTGCTWQISSECHIMAP